MMFKNFLKEMDVDLSNGQMTPSITQQESNDPIDSIKMDVPLFIRVLEYSHENAKTDQELHEITERAVQLSKSKTLTMDDYASLVTDLRREVDDPNETQVNAY